MPLVSDSRFIELLLKDSGGVRFTYRDKGTWGHLNTLEGDAFAGNAKIKATQHVGRIATGLLGTLAIEDVVRVNDVRYRVIDHSPVGDGSETDLILQPV